MVRSIDQSIGRSIPFRRLQNAKNFRPGEGQNGHAGAGSWDRGNLRNHLLYESKLVVQSSLFQQVAAFSCTLVIQPKFKSPVAVSATQTAKSALVIVLLFLARQHDLAIVLSRDSSDQDFSDQDLV